MKRILISPIGLNDPIGKGGMDGPMLHIVRYYIPDKVYLLLTTDMYERHIKDNRYAICIKLLNDLLKKKGKTTNDIKVQAINLKINDPSRYESFPIISQKIDEIISEEKNAEFLINISSGTQQMGIAICVDIVSNSRNILPIQVLSPAPQSKPCPVTNDNWEQLMQENLDNFPELEAKNRCIQTDLYVLRHERLFAKIESLIKGYRYSNALELLSYEEKFNDTELFALIKAADSYSAYNLTQLKSTKSNFVNLPKDEILQLLVVAYNNLELKIFTKEYNDFCTRITPLFYEMLKKLIGDEIINQITDNKNDKLYINPDKVKKYRILNNNCDKQTPLASWNMLYLYKDLYGENDTYSRLEIIRAVEESARNQVAHEIRPISEKAIRSLSDGYKPMDVIKAFEFLLLNEFRGVAKTHLKFYQNINSLIYDAIAKAKRTN